MQYSVTEKRGLTCLEVLLFESLAVLTCMVWLITSRSAKISLRFLVPSTLRRVVCASSRVERLAFFHIGNRCSCIWYAEIYHSIHCNSHAVFCQNLLVMKIARQSKLKSIYFTDGLAPLWCTITPLSNQNMNWAGDPWINAPSPWTYYK